MLWKIRTTFDEIFDLKRTLREGNLVCGGKRSGKTNLGFNIADKLLSCGVKLKVFDPSMQWRKKSNVPYYQKVRLGKRISSNLLDCVFDVSALRIKDARMFISEVVRTNFEIAVMLSDAGVPYPWICFVFEESQQLLGRHPDEEIMRLVTTGRNYNLAYLAIVQRPATLNTTAIELSGQKWIGKLDGPNDIRKIRAWLPKDMAWKLRDFRVETFAYQYGSTTKIISTPLFIKPGCEQYQKPTLIQRIKNLWKNGQTVETSHTSSSLRSNRKTPITGLGWLNSLSINIGMDLRCNWCS